VFPLFGILHRMIFWELLRVFLMTLTGLTGLFLLGLVVQQAAQMGLSPSQTLAIVPLLVPMTLPFTIPSTTLFASCVVYGRLSTDNEAVAMKAAGVDLYTILRPALLLGALTTAVTVGLYYSFIPRTQTMVQQQLLQDPEEVLYNMLKRDRCFRPSNFPYVIYVRDVQGRRLLDVVIKRRAKVKAKDGNEVYHGYDFVARAQEARIIVDLEKATLALDPNKWVVWSEGANLFAAGSKPLDIPLPEMFSAKNAKSRVTALEWEELPERIRELEEKREALQEKRRANRELAEKVKTSDRVLAKTLADQDPHYIALSDEMNRQIRVVQYEQFMRPALGFGCLCFAVIGCPVGIWANRADYLSTFVTCFLPTVFVYYPLMLAGGGLARDGKVPMALGVWAANIVAGLAAALLTWRLIRR
jgi:lipopolysaccharide export system permease protein